MRPRGLLRQEFAAAPVLVGLLLAHGGLLWGLAPLLRPRLTQPLEARLPPVIWMRLPPELRPAPAAPAAQRPTNRPRADSAAAPERSFEALRIAPPAPASAGVASAPVPSTMAAPAEAPVAAASAPPETVPLKLALPRAGTALAPPAAWAAQDDRLGKRPTRDDRLAQALGTDGRLQESQRGDQRRFRQGRDCVDAAPARESQLNPFNQSVAATPRQIRPC